MADFTEEMFGNGAEEVAPEPVSDPAPVVETPQAPEVIEAPAPEVVTPEPRQDHTVPLPKYLDTRDELKEAKRRIAEFEAQQQRQKPQAIPDSLDDPEGFNRWNQQQIQAATEKVKLDLSWSMATQASDEATVLGARDWAVERANADPAFKFQLEQAIQNQPHPFDWIVRQHKQSADLEEYHKDPVAFAQRILASQAPAAPVAAPVMPVAMMQPAVKPAAPPRSIASDATAPSAVVDPSADFMAIFDKR